MVLKWCLWTGFLKYAVAGLSVEDLARRTINYAFAKFQRCETWNVLEKWI